MAGNDDVRKILGQLQQQARDTTRELSKARAELAAQEREAKQSALVWREIHALPKADASGEEVRVYRSVGKMFMLDSRPNVETSLKTKEKTAKEAAAKLTNKQKYLEVEIQSNQRALREVLRGLERSGLNA